jgi:hypothetical protein
VSPSTLRTDTVVAQDNVRLRQVTIAYAGAILLHGADHLRRGPDVVTTQVRAAGATQFLVTLVVLVLVERRHRWGPASALALGSASATLFVAVHFLPYWGPFSDAFTGHRLGPNVTPLSWAAALIEVAAGAVLASAGARSLATSGSPA